MDITHLLRNIKLVLTDVDGVLTNGTLYYGIDGEHIKAFNVYDGLGIRLLELIGVRVGVVSGRDSDILRIRLMDLGIECFELGTKNKRDACMRIIEKVGCKASQAAFVGDDIIDLPAFEVCGLSVAVNNSPIYIKSKTDVLLQKSGGEGALREFVDMILQAKGKTNIFTDATAYEQLERLTIQ